MKWVLLSMVGLGLALGSWQSARATVYSPQEPVANFGTLNQANVGPNGNGGANNYCAPTATMNSFTYLETTFPDVYGNSLMGGQGTWLAAAQLLAGPAYMNTDPNAGTTEDNWVNGKANYITNFAPNTTYFTGWDSDAMNNRPSWCQNANPTAANLLQELNANEDVELGIDPSTTGIGHVLTLTGLTWNDATTNGIFDLGDTLTLNTIDPANPLVNTAITLSPGVPMTISGGPYNGYSLTGALAESVPEPSTLVLLGIGAISLLAYAWRRRTA